MGREANKKRRLIVAKAESQMTDQLLGKSTEIVI